MKRNWKKKSRKTENNHWFFSFYREYSKKQSIFSISISILNPTVSGIGTPLFDSRASEFYWDISKYIDMSTYSMNSSQQGFIPYFLLLPSGSIPIHRVRPFTQSSGMNSDWNTMNRVFFRFVQNWLCRIRAAATADPTTSMSPNRSFWARNYLIFM